MAAEPAEADGPTPDSAGPRPWLRRVVLAAMVGVLVVPVVTNSDDFPLSTYPMYSRTRGTEVSFVTAHGVNTSGERLTLGLDVIGTSDDPLVVAGELRAAIRAGRSDEHCRAILGRATNGLPQVVAVEVVSERHNVVDHTVGQPSLISRTVHSECGVAEVPK